MRVTSTMRGLMAVGAESPGLDGQVRALLETDFTLSEGCLLLTGRFERNRHLRLDQFEDRVAFECEMNHIELASGYPAAELAALLLEAVELLRIELLTASPPGEVRVIGSVDLDNAVTTLRFYMRDPGERVWFDFEAADRSGQAVLIADFD